MCGRFFRREYNWSVYANETDVTPVQGVAPPEADWNAAPGQHHPIIRQMDHGAERELVPAYWGLVPSWWTKPIKERRFSGIYTDLQSAPERPVYRGAFRYRRCLVPVSGYYLWSGEGRARTPFVVAPSQDPNALWCLAGLWDRALIHGGVIESFTLMTTTPNDAVAGLVTHMPVILKPSQYADWLQRPKACLEALREPYPAASVSVWPVSPAVGKVQNNSIDLIRPA